MHSCSVGMRPCTPVSLLLCRDTEESTRLRSLSEGSGSPESAIPLSVRSLHCHLSLAQPPPPRAAALQRWFPVMTWSTRPREMVWKAQICCSNCAEGKFCSFSEFLSWSKAFLCCPLIIVQAAKLSLVCLPGNSCSLASWYRQGVACSSPEAKVSLSAASHPCLHLSAGKVVQADNGLSKNNCKSHQTVVSASASMRVSATANHTGISCSSSGQVLLDGLLYKVTIRKSFLLSFRCYLGSAVCDTQ